MSEPRVKYLGVWRRGPTGLEAAIWKDGTETDVANICANDQIRDLLRFLKTNWPKEFNTFLDLTTRKPDGTKAASPNTQTWQIPSASSGGFHTVTRQYDRWSCTCQGYMWRYHCKHIDEAKEANS